MDNWTQISTFTLPHEAHLAKAKLESEGIETMLQDELTTQVHNYYSNAIGGVKLFVKDSETNRAILILKEARIIKEENSSPSPFLVRFDKQTKRIPLLGKLIVEFRLIILVSILIALILLPIILFSLPSTKEKLTDGRWCLDTYYYEGQRYLPNTQDYLTLDFGDGCNETISFMNYNVTLPGFNSPSLNGYWRLENKKLIIHGLDTLSHLYEGEYKIRLDHNNLFLESDKVIITGTKHRIRLW